MTLHDICTEIDYVDQDEEAKEVGSDKITVLTRFFGAI